MSAWMAVCLDTYLAGDGSPSDRLVIDGSTATGTTTVIATDTGGGGALTTGDGILVIDAVNGGTTAPGAFAGFGAAGPYEYLLERGGLTAGSENDWFLPQLRRFGTAALPTGGFALCGHAGDGPYLWPRAHRHAARKDGR